MKAIIVSHGDIHDYKYIGDIIKNSDMIICADGGAEHVLKCGQLPHVVIGDLDSIDRQTLDTLENNSIKIVKYPKEKDYTDTQLAVNYALEEGADEIILLGSVGDRLDHTLANVFLLVKLAAINIKSSVINEKNAVYITKDSIKLAGNKGDIVSLIPVGGDVKGIYTEGLQYKLSGSEIKMGDPLGISNVFIDQQISIKIESGFLLVIKSRD